MPMDIGLGLILGLVLNQFSNLGYGLCLFLGVVAALLPDLDYVYALLRTKSLPHSEHRDGLHYPLLFTPVIGILGLLINPWIGLTFALGALTHFIHDSIGVGWGIKWLFPFKTTSYMFLYKAVFPTSHKLPTRLVYSWTDKQRQNDIQKYGDPKWIQHMYFQYHPFGIVEYSFLAIGILCTIIFH